MDALKHHNMKHIIFDLILSHACYRNDHVLGNKSMQLECSLFCLKNLILFFCLLSTLFAEKRKKLFPCSRKNNFRVSVAIRLITCDIFCVCYSCVKRDFVDLIFFDWIFGWLVKGISAKMWLTFFSHHFERFLWYIFEMKANF